MSDGQGINFIIGLVILCVIPALPVLASRGKRKR